MAEGFAEVGEHGEPFGDVVVFCVEGVISDVGKGGFCGLFVGAELAYALSDELRFDAVFEGLDLEFDPPVSCDDLFA